MIVDVFRGSDDPNSVPSKVSVNGIFQCYGLEPARINPVHPGHPCIPAGEYDVIITLSPHLGYETPELLNVPGRSDIRWHVANYPKDVLGCLAVGETRSVDFVGNSKAAFEALMTKLATRLPGEKITARYHDPS